MEEHDEVLCAHYGRMLGLVEGWKVTRVNLEVMERRLELGVEWTEKGAHCPECGKQCARYDHAPERRWRHLDAMGFETQIVSRTPRANCPEHGIGTMAVPWAGKHGRFTLAFEALAIKVMLCCQSVTAAREILGLSWDGVQSIIDRAVERGMDRRRLEGITAVGMDEKSFLKGQSYASLLFDLKPGAPRVLEVSMGRDREAASLLWETLPEEVLDSIEAVCMDMSGIYHQVASEMVPQAAIVHDRFHVSKHLNEALDQVRRAENKVLSADGDDRLKGTRHLFLFNLENLPKDRVDEFEQLRNSTLKSARAWAIKESFRAFWECRTVEAARAFFERWYRWAAHSKLVPIARVAAMLKRHIDGLVNFALHPITNAVAEGFNSKIQSIKSSARGFRSFLNYRSRILFFCGNLDLSPSPTH